MKAVATKNDLVICMSHEEWAAIREATTNVQRAAPALTLLRLKAQTAIWVLEGK